MSIYHKWLAAKQAEQDATNARREIEDAMIAELSIAENLDGTKSFERDGLQIKVTGRINRTIDGDKLQELAAESGLTEHLSGLFRWKPEIKMREWKGASPEITQKLAGAITAKPGRPSFSISNKEQ